MKSGNARATMVRNFLSVCILFLGAASIVLAQAGRGSISGLVSDPSGAIVPGARWSCESPATGVTQHTVTSAAGTVHIHLSQSRRLSGHGQPDGL